MIIIDPTMKSTPSTATALASNRRKQRLAGRNNPYVQTHDNVPQHRSDTETNSSNNASSPSSQSSQLSPAARRRLLRSQPGQTRNNHQSSHNSKEVRRRQPQHLEVGPYNTQQPSQNQSASLSQLNLHCTDSVDSDDNGTCFNSIGTTTPRHPSVTSSPHKYQESTQQTHLHHDLRLPTADFGSKSNSWNLAPSSTDRRHKLSPLAEVSPSPSRANKLSLLTPKAQKDSIWDSTTAKNSSRYNPRSDNNSAYSEFEHHSAENGSHPAAASAAAAGHHPTTKQSQRRGRSRTTRYKRESKVHPETSSVTSSIIGSSVRDADEGNFNFTERSPGQTGCAPNLTEGGMDRRGTTGNHDLDELLNKPHVKAAVGVGAAATLCGEDCALCMRYVYPIIISLTLSTLKYTKTTVVAILGPVGLLVGVASAGIGMGVLQIPKEQRDNVCNHAATSLGKARDVALDLSDTVSTSCGKLANNENPVDAAAEVRKEFMDKFCAGIDQSKSNLDDEGSLVWREEGENSKTLGTTEIKPVTSSPMAAALNHSVHNVKGRVGEVFGDEVPSPSQTRDTNTLSATEEDGMPRAACCRKGRVVPLGQIHSLRPSLQPRAWLDVMASAHTTRDDKNEAMEEILILAKDKVNLPVMSFCSYKSTVIESLTVIYVSITSFLGYLTLVSRSKSSLVFFFFNIFVHYSHISFFSIAPTLGGYT